MKIKNCCLIVFYAFILSIGVMACGGSTSTSPDGNNLNDQDGTQDLDGLDGNESTGGDTNGNPSDNDLPPICGEMTIVAEKIPPNLLLVVDKSGSMSERTAFWGSRTKIQDAKEAINLLLDEGEGSIRFGWLPYPSNQDCGPGQVAVECSDTSVSTIRSLVNSLVPEGGTPTGESLQKAEAAQMMHDATRLSFVVLLTDGVPTCPNGDGFDETQADADLAVSAVQTLRASGIDTFVIGLGENINSSNPGLLNEMAIEGGRARSGTVKYYEANSFDDLKAAFAEIQGTVIGCSLALDKVPEFPDYLWVFFDGIKIDRDDGSRASGWDYDAARNQIDVYGSHCEQLRNDQVSAVDVKMGCRPPD
jgi:hypothetical protein